MRVILAKSAGFCYGVERAVKLAEQTARDKGGCVMLGSIIHNAHVVQGLAALGARQVDSPQQVRPGETVIKWPTAATTANRLSNCCTRPTVNRSS